MITNSNTKDKRNIVKNKYQCCFYSNQKKKKKSQVNISIESCFELNYVYNTDANT